MLAVRDGADLFSLQLDERSGAHLTYDRQQRGRDRGQQHALSDVGYRRAGVAALLVEHLLHQHRGESPGPALRPVGTNGCPEGESLQNHGLLPGSCTARVECCVAAPGCLCCTAACFTITTPFCSFITYFKVTSRTPCLGIRGLGAGVAHPRVYRFLLQTVTAVSL